MLWRMVLGGLIALAACGCGTATAKPPLGPLPEGRELDPVTRDSYGGFPTPPTKSETVRSAPRPGDSCALSLVAARAVLDAILDGLTIPLGPLLDERDVLQRP